MNEAPVTQSNDQAEQYPSLGRRFLALVVDWILCILVAGLFAQTLVDTWVPLVVLVAEYGFFIGLFGETPGMRVMKITCMGDETGRPVGVIRALVRGALLAFVIPALIMDGRRRGLHDRAAGTLVRDARAVKNA